jgi:DNA-binding NarL/FixJ family response regulator
MSEVNGWSLELQGRSAHAAGDYATAARVYEEAFVVYRSAGDLVAAARAARTVGWFRGWVFGEWAVHRGWVARARRLLEEADDDHGRGWVVLDDALTGSDLEVQRSQYLEAIAVARRTGDRDLECDATASLGMMLVFSDLVDEGMAYLDEALAAICGGEVSELPVVEGCLCGLITACERTRDVSRAEEWLRAAERVMQRGNHLAVAGHCRSQYAGILVAAGRWEDAEDELTAALDLLPDGMAVRERARCRLADLRLRQGRLEEAEQLLAGLDHHEDAVLPQAALHLARSRHDLAIELLDSALDAGEQQPHLAVPLLAVKVEAHLAAGDLDAARRSSDQLSGLATDQTSTYVRAVAAVARARICTASGDGDARTCWHQAVAMFASARMPAEVAAARFEVARVIAVDRPAAAIAELEAAHQTFEGLGARRSADQAAALLRELGGPIKTGPKRGTELTRREDEVLELLALGLSNIAIGERLFISSKTAEHHVGRILSKLGLQRRAEAAAYVARRA